MATYSSVLGLENPRVRGAWPVSVHRVAELNMTEAIWCTHTHLNGALKFKVSINICYLFDCQYNP